MHDGNDEQVALFPYFQIPSFYIRILPGITKTEITIIGKHKTKV